MNEMSRWGQMNSANARDDSSERETMNYAYAP